MIEVTLRAARASDYEAFVRLNADLGTGDTLPSIDAWRAELMPQTVIAERGADVAGYAFFQTLRHTGYLRQLVVAAKERGKGLGRHLMHAVADTLRGSAVGEWRLNVKPDNLIAIGLYENMGLREAYASSAMSIAWATVERLAADVDGVTASRVTSEDDHGIEQALAIIPGSFADARVKSALVSLQLRDREARVCGAAIFDPRFPGAFPFRVREPRFAGQLLRAMQPYAQADHDRARLVVEDDLALRDTLVAAGALVHLEFLHFAGALPAAQ